MRKLSSLILLAFLALRLAAQTSPHGDGFAVTCKDCHTTTGWKVDLKAVTFSHSTTRFPLTGQHQAVTCMACHKSLEFSRAPHQCVECHTDMHGRTVGDDCGRCHTTGSWIINNITEIHQRSRFPLVGAHVTADCYDCHTNATSNLLLFGPLGVECIDCHQNDYNSAVNPNHVSANFPKDCSQCHKITANSWSGAGINHSFFPLTGGHSGVDCKTCHTTPDYASTSAECYSCHADNYNATTNPGHNSLGFSTACQTCHTTNPGWKPAEYRDHDAKSFPIYSGKHNGTWSVCTQCHTNPASYAQFTCLDCHEHNQAEMNGAHDGVTGYAYSSPACFACHPTGSKEGTFNHANSGFTLTGAHATVECAKCHVNGYVNTSPVCYSCHAPDYNQSVNPNHGTISIPTDCGTCHTTQPGWKPATFAIHNNYYVLAGAHIPVECNTCHNGNYTNTPNQCFGCHADKYNASTNPNHITSGFPTTCETCHSQTAWKPSNFDHNNTYPLTGAHATIAANCDACHQGSYTNTPNTCEGCHMPNYNASTNPNHPGIGIPTTCNTCHTTNPNWTPATFPIHNTYYVLAGAHISVACNTCHNGNYNTAPNTCVGCHQANYNQTTNPSHTAAQFPITCADCHSQSAWTPANWNHDGQYFPIYSGKHNGRWTLCSDCHPNSSNYAVFTCTTSCHPQNSTNNEHQGVGGYTYNSAACYNCHPTGSGGKMFQRIDKQND